MKKIFAITSVVSGLLIGSQVIASPYDYMPYGNNYQSGYYAPYGQQYAPAQAPSYSYPGKGFPMADHRHNNWAQNTGNQQHQKDNYAERLKLRIFLRQNWWQQRI